MQLFLIFSFLHKKKKMPSTEFATHSATTINNTANGAIVSLSNSSCKSSMKFAFITFYCFALIEIK